MKKFLTLLGIVFTISSSAQSGSVEGHDINLPKITSPSPDVYNFKEYGEVPVSYYTGIPQISIPIYQITTKAGLSVPISLNYHAGGIRVDEMAGTVGLGWSLKTGGAMSNNINGVPDYNGANNFPSSAITSEIQMNGGYVDPMYDNGEPIYQFMKDIYDGTFNCQPDTYQFSVPSGGGEFYVDSSGESHLFPAGNFEIDFNNLEIIDGGGNITKFGFGDSTSKDPSGCKYTSLDDPANSSSRSYNIDYINTYLNETIHYSYRNITYSYLASKVETEYDILQQATTGCNNISDAYCENLIDVNQRLLTQIDFPGGNIIFKYSDEAGYAINGNSNRLDLPGGVALREITIKNNNNKIIAEYQLNYNYFIAPGGTSSDNYRLKLEEVIKNNEEEHVFTYYEDENLPKRLSNSQDFWGFYNGQSGNNTLIPEMIYNGQTLPGGNRTIGSLSKVRANALKKITYPTKGSSTFIYEQNDYYSTNETTTDIISEGFSLGANEISGLSGSKTVNQSQEGEIIDFKIMIDNLCENDDQNQGLGDTYCLVNLKDSSGNLYASYTQTGEYIIDPQITDWSQITLEMEVDGCSCVAEVSWNRSVSTTGAKNVKAAGLRIGQVVNNPIVGNTITRDYSYNVPGTSNSSGKFHDYPQFYSKLTVPGKPGSEGYPTTETCQFMIRQNSPFYTLNNSSGQSVGYKYVQESISGNGATHYEFSNYNDLALSYSLPVVPVTSYAWKRGLLLKQEIFSESGELLKKTENTYDFDNQFASNSSEYQGGDNLSLGISVSLSGLRAMSSTVVAPILKYNINYFPTSWIKNVMVSNWIYNNGQSFHTVTNQSFNDLESLFPTFTSIDDGVNVNEIYTTYPSGVTSTTSLGHESLSSTEFNDILQLQLSHRNILPIQKETKIKNSTGTVVASFVRRNLYKNYNGFVSLSEIKTSKKSTNLEDRLEYHRYDASGNPVDVSKTEGSHVIYLWGYNDQFPIAKIENATYSAVASALGKTVSTLDTTIDESDMAAINLLRSNANLPQSLITTYTYDPLIGITNMRDSRGSDTQYTYDNFGRLQSIKDDAGNLIKDFKYHYQQ